jgi:hypothetical protein
VLRQVNRFYTRLQRFLAGVAVTPSATRGNAPGARESIISSLSELPLPDFADPERFTDTLDRWTHELRLCEHRSSCFPSIPWGTARKCLNIFLRDATYNSYTRKRYGLDAVEFLLEIPLDNDVAKGLQSDARRLNRTVSNWKSIITLTPAQNEEWQSVAEVIAASKYHTYRAHLDLIYWRPPKVKTND